MKAWFKSTCHLCKSPITEGDRIRPWFGSWVHDRCAEERLRATSMSRPELDVELEQHGLRGGTP